MYLVKNSKSPNYQVVYFVNGKRTTISTNTGNKKEAEFFLLNFKVNGQTPKKKDIPEKHNSEISITLSQFKDEYLEFIRPTKSAKYIDSIELSFRQLEKSIGNMPLKEIDVRILDKFITTTFGRTQRGAALYYRTLKAAFTKAVSWNYLKVNPFKKIKLPRIPKNYPVFISLEEFKIILSQVKEDFLKDIYTVAFYTGMRQGELVNMKWNWIDINNSTIQVRCTDEFLTKSKKERIVPINPTIKIIFAHRQKKGKSIYVFTNANDIKLNQNFVSKKFKKAVRATGLNEEIHFHTLRHSFASILVQKGVSLYVVKELLGHEDLSTTQIYSHLQQQNLRNAVNIL